MRIRRTGMWVAGLLAFCPSVFAQAIQRPAPPVLPADILGPPLVAWSDLQTPRPMPQPATDQQQPAQTAGSQTQPLAQAFAGMIVKDAGRYVLKTQDGAVYQIDDQDKARPYEGKQVKVSGSLEAKANLLHLTSIELVS